MERKKFADHQPPKFMPFLFWQNGNQHKNIFAFTNERNEIKSAVDGSCVFVLANFNPQWKELTRDEKEELINERSSQKKEFGFITLGELPDEKRNAEVRYYKNDGSWFSRYAYDFKLSDQQMNMFVFWEYVDAINPKLQGTFFNNTFIDRSDEVKEDIPQDGRTISLKDVQSMGRVDRGIPGFVNEFAKVDLMAFQKLTPEELDEIIARERNANLYYRSSDGTFKQLPEGTTISNYARNSKGDYVEIKSGRIDDPEYQAMSFDKPVDSKFDDIKIKVKNLSVDQLRELIYQNTNPADPDQEFIDLIKMMLDDYLKYKNSGALGLAEDILHNIKEITGDKERGIDQMIDKKTKDKDA